MKDVKDKIKTLKVIKHAGIPTETTTLDGKKVYRQEKIYLPSYGRYVMCAPYDNHFIYLTDTKGWAIMCTCGSAGVISGYNAYKNDASPTSGEGIVPGELLVCYTHANTGRHADGTS